MNTAQFFLRLVVRAATLVLMVSSLSACGQMLATSHKEELVPVSIVGVHHMGRNASVPEFYVNGSMGGNVGRKGGGGGFFCCVALPEKWRPGLIVEVRWRVINWKSEIQSGNGKQKEQILSFDGPYLARVPVEEFDVANDLYVHFFMNGRVRVVASFYSITHELHPVRFNDEKSGEIATTGVRIEKIFPEDEQKSAD